MKPMKRRCQRIGAHSLFSRRASPGAIRSAADRAGQAPRLNELSSATQRTQRKVLLYQLLRAARLREIDTPTPNPILPRFRASWRVLSGRTGARRDGIRLAALFNALRIYTDDFTGVLNRRPRRI